MKTITIPSVNNEDCGTNLMFHEKKYEVIPWNVDVVCNTPSFEGKISINLDDEYVKGFIEDLEKIEKKRKGECSVGYQMESSFVLTIRSVDSVGHFVAEVIMEDNRESRGHDNIDTLKITYEIEPSLLSTLLKDFKELYK